MIELKLRGMDNALAMLKQLPPEVVSKRGGPVKTAVRKGMLVIAREAALNLAHSTESLTGDATSTGLLAKSLIVSRGRPDPNQNGERYLLRIKKRSYSRAGKTVTTQQTGEWLEYGNAHQPAEPYIRPAAAAKAQEAIDTVGRELTRAIDRVVKKLNKGPTR